MNQHQTVMLAEAVDLLHIQCDGTYIDATLGAGGHSREIVTQLKKGNTFLGMDADQTALNAFKKVGLPKTEATIMLECENFRHLAQVVKHYELSDVRGVLADLGWRMEQFTEGNKGFSFQKDEPLLMTYGDPDSYPFTAKDLVNEWAEEDIANVIYGYGEDRKARRIAKAIVETREESPIETSGQLAAVVESVVKRGRSKIHPATKTFQAVRIAVNDEFSVLEEFITSAFDLLEPGGRFVIITFHSLEDRIVKHQFRSLAEDGAGELLTKKPVVAGEAEIAENPRARSAKLRAIKKS